MLRYSKGRRPAAGIPLQLEFSKTYPNILAAFYMPSPTVLARAVTASNGHFDFKVHCDGILVITPQVYKHWPLFRVEDLTDKTLPGHAETPKRFRAGYPGQGG